VINGGHYWTQTEFSNYAYAHFGPGFGCQHSEAGALSRSVQAAEPVDLREEAYPTTLPADGRARSKVYLSVDLAGSAAKRDRITFTTRTLRGEGSCGTVTARTASTDRNGAASTTYVASTSNLTCEITGTDAQNGRSVSAIVYQGTARAQAPIAAARFPRAVHAGRAVTFRVRFRNRSAVTIDDAQIVFDAFGSNRHSPKVQSDQVNLAYSLHGRPFRRVSLGGETTPDGGSIRGVIGSAAGLSIPAHSATVVTFRMKVHGNVPRVRVPLLSLEAYLYQVNPATAAAAVLADTSSTNVSVR